jgi:Zn-finger nucleic acid-binding protein
MPLYTETLDGSQTEKRSDAPYRTAPTRLEQVPGAIWVDRCKACNGIWFDSGEMHTAMRGMELVRVPDPPAEVRVEKSGSDLQCPRCGGHLDWRRCRSAPEVTYDLCKSCGGVWLDAGEIHCLADPLVALSAIMMREFG